MAGQELEFDLEAWDVGDVRVVQPRIVHAFDLPLTVMSRSLCGQRIRWPFVEAGPHDIRCVVCEDLDQLAPPGGAL